MFERVIARFDEYYRRTDAAGIGLNKPAGVLVRKRLVQLEWILTKVTVAERQHREIIERVGGAMKATLEEYRAKGLDWEDVPAGTGFMTREEGRRTIDLGEKIELLTEAFYYLAENIRTLMEGKRGVAPPLPHLRAPGYIGVSRVRHNLVEHYLPDGRLVATGFGHGGPHGPVLNAIRQQGIDADVEDAGLYVNAQELADTLERLLADAIAKLPS